MPFGLSGNASIFTNSLFRRRQRHNFLCFKVYRAASRAKLFLGFNKALVQFFITKSDQRVFMLKLEVAAGSERRRRARAWSGSSSPSPPTPACRALSTHQKKSARNSSLSLLREPSGRSF
jgi:hypothetical protein